MKLWGCFIGAYSITDIDNELAEIRAARTRIYSAGQANSSSGRNTQRASLADLDNRERTLLLYRSKMDAGPLIETDASGGTMDPSRSSRFFAEDQ